MRMRNLVGRYREDIYIFCSQDECEIYSAYELADSFDIMPS